MQIFNHTTQEKRGIYLFCFFFIDLCQLTEIYMFLVICKSKSNNSGRQWHFFQQVECKLHWDCDFFAFFKGASWWRVVMVITGTGDRTVNIALGASRYPNFSRSNLLQYTDFVNGALLLDTVTKKLPKRIRYQTILHVSKHW